MSLPRIIGITGYARHGKDTVARVLVRELGYTRVGLADIMKAALLVLDPMVYVSNDPLDAGTETAVERLSDRIEAQGWEGAKTLPEVRRLLQVFGTEVGRNMLGEDVWIGAAVKATKGFYGSERKIVFSDIRFQNEADFIRRNRGEVWKVVRPDFDNGVPTTHASEREIATLRADWVIPNDGTKSQLQEQVFRALRYRLARADVVVDA